MHVIFRESHGLEDGETPMDLGQDPADLVVLSFSDSDLGAFAAGWQLGRPDLPTLRLANLVALKHPLSVDTYIDQTLSGAKAILIRLIGGDQYWSYGLGQVVELAKKNNIALAVLPADGREDAQLDAASNLPVSTLRRLAMLCDQGGAVAAQAALAQLSLAAGLYAAPVPGIKTVPECGLYLPGKGVVHDVKADGRPVVAISFYRSYLTAADTGPVDDLFAALDARGFQPVGLFATSLKNPQIADAVRGHLQTLHPVAIVNATAFSAKSGEGQDSPLDLPGCPVFQVALSTSRKKAWAEVERGLAPSDLAMSVVLPEVDGRIFAGVASFKSPGKKDPDLQYSRFTHQGVADRIALIADRVTAWHRLATAAAADRDIAFVLSTYPGKDWQLAHAVGLDTLASVETMMGQMQQAGYDCFAGEGLGQALTVEELSWSLAAYKQALAALPQSAQDDLHAAWGDPEHDDMYRNGAFHFRAIRRGKALIALQPERGDAKSRDDDYHDVSRVPRHGYVAFYLWLRHQQMHALCHVGAHGTVEWLPGKSVALSRDCWPEMLIGAMPVLYPFIVNDPGEAAQAKRRIAAVTIGHMPPPLTESAVPDALKMLEGLLDEFSVAEGLDPARRDRIIGDIIDEAERAGLSAELGIEKDMSQAETVTRIDRFVCDIKESQFGEGLHIFGSGDCGDAEIQGLLDGLDGKFVKPGPSGSPSRGRSDVKPTGRNLFSTDPRAVPTRAAHSQGIKLAEELVRRHLQDHGDYPKNLIIDLWGSATMRTAGEEFAMGLHLAGIAPQWDRDSGRVSGFDVMSLTEIGRPRIDVTFRVSGLFRDVFPGLAQLFENAADKLAEREEEGAENPYLVREPRVFSPKPGLYGFGMTEALEQYSDEGRMDAGEAWLSGSEWIIDAKGDAAYARDALEARVRKSDSYVHIQDLPETDILLASDYVAHEGGIVAAAAKLGHEIDGRYHLDSTRYGKPVARTVNEEIARVVHARATNPDWTGSMMRHGFRGGAEIAATLDHLAGFAHLNRDLPDHLFDLYYDATLGKDDIVEFLERENPQALDAMRDRFRALHDAGLWQARRNSILADLFDGADR